MLLFLLKMYFLNIIPTGLSTLMCHGVITMRYYKRSLQEVFLQYICPALSVDEADHTLDVLDSIVWISTGWKK